MTRLSPELKFGQLFKRHGHGGAGVRRGDGVQLAGLPQGGITEGVVVVVRETKLSHSGQPE